MHIYTKFSLIGIKNGAQDGTQTHTVSPPADFKSATSVKFRHKSFIKNGRKGGSCNHGDMFIRHAF